MNRTRAWIATGVVIALSIGAASWWRSERAAQKAIDDPAATPVAEAAPRDSAAPASTALPALVIGEYRPDTAGLPPVDAPLAVQIPELKAAAARGNATAACRLADIALQCAAARVFPVVAGEASAEEQRAMEDNLREQYGDVSLDALPAWYRDHARRRLDTLAMSEMDMATGWRARGQRCEGAPAVSHDEIAAALRQAALAGEPTSMVRYASGLWWTELAMSTVGMGFGNRGPGMDWLRSPGFDQWRRDAAAVRRAGLERGDPEMLYAQFAFPSTTGLRPLAAEDPVESAAALRAYALLARGETVESTRSLGLSSEQAAEADRRADAWAARGRERGRRAEDVTDRMLARGGSTCD
jgi:hypothetical protein